ncbi:hypothetical protein MPTK1_6g19440 [Marchantia polymorpha subsp. ruderalis]|uniref:SURP motif domain-containing protein n=2 Tax=Marchantia polymorpha TaxID=3197 RepID=A0AAF6BTT5_MARPO|nr:hypothetical protein MARPO_0045s0119 [Marchantia polymorpha]BBN15419.1 hypothetical protein Mp_6g19440 [Marchantia polymorpha subsp. ruderalis]|eukprot:PTQ39468.1 hypothetical protein MARPO_0045s0119 [Marchantia polymorpha]
MLGVRSFHESFYGTPKPAETGRRGKKWQPKVKEEPENEIAVVGVHYRSFDDDSMAAFVNSPAAQVPWNGDETLLIDRYDVRHLLQDLSGSRRRRRPASPSLDASKEELDYERYRDLEGLENPSPVPEDDENAFVDKPGGLYQRVAFNYRSGGDQSAQGESGDRSTEDIAFIPPFVVPGHLQSKLPSSLKVHQIMAGTAKFVIEHGGQAEIVLRVKQASNPTFGFLMPDHHHHEYFRFLVDNPQHVGIGLNAEPIAAVEVLSEEAEGGLSLLGTAYGDSEDDEADVATEVVRDQRESEEGDIDSKGADVSQDRSEESEHVSHGNSSPAEVSEKDSGDSNDPTKAVEAPGIQTDDLAVIPGEEKGEIGKGEVGPGLPEPLPPGTETLDPMEVEYEKCNGGSGYPEEDLPPYKEPPLQQRRIIDKMVEFISRNGKEFEAIVRERDKKDARFQFLLPWNEYYPYFSRSLEAAQQANGSSEPPPEGRPPTDESTGSFATGGSVEDALVKDHFLKGVPFWDESAVLDISSNVDVVDPETEEKNLEISHNGIGGMGFDAVMAAVRAATRGLSRAVEDGELGASEPRLPEKLEHPEIGSDDAVMAAIRAVTGGARWSKSEISSAAGKVDTVSSGGPLPLTGANHQLSEHVVEGVKDEENNISALGVPGSTSEINPGSDGDAVVVGKVVAKAAALAAGQEGDSADALLSPSGKRKAERLKKAKLFAAMIREGTASLLQSGQESGSHGVSASPSVEKSSQAGLCMDVYSKDSVSDKVQSTPATMKVSGDTCDEESLGIREQTGDALVPYAYVEDDMQHPNESGKERKVGSKEADEKYRKHHRKRKSYHDGDDRRKESKDDSDTERRRDRRHYQNQEEKYRGRDHDGERKTRDKSGYNTKRKAGEDEYRDVPGEERKDLKESRKDRRYRHDADSKREARRGYEFEEISRHDDGHGHEVEGKYRSSRHRCRNGSEDKRPDGKHEYSNERRKESEYDHDSEEKQNDRRHREDPDERRESQHRHGSDERRKDRRHSHGKKKKQKDDHLRDVSGGEDNGDEKHVHKRSRRHRQELEIDSTHPHSGKHTTRGRDKADDRTHRETGSEKHHEVVIPLQNDARTEPTSRELPSTLVDVPDDIRAKVRAMLALI